MKNANKSQSVRYQVVHRSPGRLRVRIPQLTVDFKYSTRLKSLVNSLNFVTDARINSAASSVIVEYSEVAAPEVLQEQILAAIDQASEVEDNTQLLNNSPLYLNIDNYNSSRLVPPGKERGMLAKPSDSVAPLNNDESNLNAMVATQTAAGIALPKDDLDAIAELNDAPLDGVTAQEYSLLIRGNYSVSAKLNNITSSEKETSITKFGEG